MSTDLRFGQIACPHLSNLARLEASLSQRGSSAESIAQEMIGPKQAWWNACQESVREAPEWFSSSKSHALIKWLRDNVSDSYEHVARVAESAFLIGQVLATSSDKHSVDNVPIVLNNWRESGLLSTPLSPGSGLVASSSLAELDDIVRNQAQNFLTLLRTPSHDDDAESDTARAMVALTALLLCGSEPNTRPISRVSVVFGISGWRASSNNDPAGVTGTIELQEFPSGPEGLFPDPRFMAGTRGGPTFSDSIAHAWRATGWSNRGRCVLWRLVLSDSTVAPSAIDGGSLGVAFALGLRDLHYRQTRWWKGWSWLRTTFHGLRPGTAVTGVMDGSDQIGRVSAMREKLRVVESRGWRLIAPMSNKTDITEAANSRIIMFAATLDEADRYARKWRVDRLATVGIVVVSIVITAIFVSVRASNNSEKIQTAQKLAETSQNLLATNVDLAELFAAKAYQMNATPQTRAALFRAVSANPRLVRSLQASGDISATTTAADGKAVFAGTQQGAVLKWRTDNLSKVAPRRTFFKLDGLIKRVATSIDGRTAAAITDSAAFVKSDAGQGLNIAITKGEQPYAVGVSPSGHYVAVSTWSAAAGVDPKLYVLDRLSGRTSHIILTGPPPDSITFSADDQVTTLDGSYGQWVRYSVPRLRAIAGSTVGFGNQDYGSALSGDGKLFGYTNSASILPLWATRGDPSIDHPNRFARVQGANANGVRPVSIAINQTGTQVAYATSSTIYVAPVVKRESDAPIPAVLPAVGSVTPSTVSFLGSSRNLILGASGDLLSIWNLDQVSRIGAKTDALIPGSCNACSGPRLSMQPNGPGVAVVDGNLISLDVQQFGSSRVDGRSRSGDPLGSYTYAPPLWTPDGRRVIVASSIDNSAEIIRPDEGLPATSYWPAAPNALNLPDAVSLLRFLPGNKEVVEVLGSGATEIRNAVSGRVVRRVNGPRDMSPTDSGAPYLPQGYVAVDSRASHTAVIDVDDGGKKVVRVISISSGEIHTLNVSDVSGIAYLGEELLVQREGGALEIWSSDGVRFIRTIQGAADIVTGPVVGGSNLVAELTNSGSLRVLDYPSGFSLGSLTPPGGAKPQSIGMAFSPDGKYLATATESDGIDASSGAVGRLTRWNMDPEVWLSTACDTAGHDLSPKQWLTFMGTPPPDSLTCLEKA